jgi:hypothetical protein
MTRINRNVKINNEDYVVGDLNQLQEDAILAIEEKLFPEKALKSKINREHQYLNQQITQETNINKKIKL